MSGQVLAENYLLLAIQAAGGMFGVWAVVFMKVGTFNIRPDIKEGAVLKSTGPYRFVRHPMYSALLTVMAATVCSEFTLLRIGAMLVLTLVVVVKLSYEEKLLGSHFADYGAYQKKTWRLIPYVY